MRLLILGGTSFLGRHLTEQALDRGFDVTLFNRGQTNPGLYAGATEIHGDRKKDLSELDGLSFDSVIDPSGYLPRDVEAAATFLKPNVPHYVFISSVSAYEDPGAPNIDEESAAFPYNPALESETEMTPEIYGPLKAECERRATAIYGDDALIIRPGLIVGRYDKTGRFSYWLQRIRQGGDVATPDVPDAPVQFLDAHDLAAWTLDLCERKTGGTINAIGPAAPMIFHELMQALKPTAPPGTKLVAIEEGFLLDQGIDPWVEMPLWIPAKENMEGFMKVKTDRMLANGMKIRPLAETVADILDEIDANGTFLAGASMIAETEEKLLAAWKAKA